MRNILKVNEFSKVGVEGHQYPRFSVRAEQQRPIPRIRAEFPRFEHVMPGIPQPLRKSPACAVIDKELHGPTTLTAARLSPAITACA